MSTPDNPPPSYSNNDNYNNNNNNNSYNWTSCRAIQGVIAQVISKSDEREAQGQFEIMINNRIYNKFRTQICTSEALFISFGTKPRPQVF